MLFYRAAVDLSRSTLNYGAGLIRRHRKAIGSPWRRLNPGQQALPVLVHLRKGETFVEASAGMGKGIVRGPAQRSVEDGRDDIQEAAHRRMPPVDDGVGSCIGRCTNPTPTHHEQGIDFGQHVHLTIFEAMPVAPQAHRRPSVRSGGWNRRAHQSVPQAHGG